MLDGCTNIIIILVGKYFVFNHRLCTTQVKRLSVEQCWTLLQTYSTWKMERHIFIHIFSNPEQLAARFLGL